MGLDIVIRGGGLVDGSGAAPVQADLGIAAGRVAAIGRIEGRGELELDGAGCLVTPGFIDIHSHSDFTLLVDPRAVSAVKQGVTLEVIGNCGFGCAPIGDPALAKDNIYGVTDDVPLNWTSLAGYFDRLEAACPAINVVALVPNGQLRRAVVGVADRPAGADEVAAMKRLLAQGLEEGAFGYSTGLEYPAETGAGEEEVTALCRVVAEAGGLYATHTRDRDRHALAAIEEALRTADRAGVRLQVSHIAPRSGDAMAERAIEIVEHARSRGQDVGFDMHTRRFGTTMLSAMLPPWALADGPQALAHHLGSAESRKRMRQFHSIISGTGDWSALVLLDNRLFPQYARRDFADIARERGQDPFDAAFDILLAYRDRPREPMVIIHSYSEAMQRAVFQQDRCLPGSDATTLAPDGPLAAQAFHGAYSWAAWFFRFMVRETGLLTAEAAIRRLTLLPAQTLGLPDRGILAIGAQADVAVFDPAHFGERATIFEPNQLAQGMRHVIVNGTPTLQDGELTGARSGHVLRRTGRR
ncbi:MAG: amidohydrolase family protein [Alphaproteobacteria bacterium]|nr:amidohydrolase family protein [Alphaproteobacteria bacterium]